MPAPIVTITDSDVVRNRAKPRPIRYIGMLTGATYIDLSVLKRSRSSTTDCAMPAMMAPTYM